MFCGTDPDRPVYLFYEGDPIGLARKAVLVALMAFSVFPFACAHGPGSAPAEDGSEPRPATGQAGDPAREGTGDAIPAPDAGTIMEATSPGVSAQEAGILAGGTPPPEYEVRGEGTLIIGGDVLVGCEQVGDFEAPRSATRAAKQQVRESQQEQMQACAEAGFPPEDGPAGGTKKARPKADRAE